jgi:hypothetical protein
MKEKTLYWVPRILTVIALLFMLMFSFDVFDGNESMGRKLLGFLMHNIPVLILIVILIIAWKWEFAGGIFFIVAFIVSCFFFHSFTGNPGSLIVTSPFLITGILFLVHHFLYGNKSIGVE